MLLLQLLLLLVLVLRKMELVHTIYGSFQLTVVLGFTYFIIALRGSVGFVGLVRDWVFEWHQVLAVTRIVGVILRPSCVEILWVKSEVIRVIRCGVFDLLLFRGVWKL